jgi:hypothetical protein
VSSKINPHSSGDDDDEEEEGEEEEAAGDGPDEDALVERRFEFKSFVAQFATEEIAGLYGSLLAGAERNSTELNRYVAVMLYRLFQATHPGPGSIFFRAAFLDPVHRFLVRAPPRVHRANAPLRHVCRMIAGAFFEALAAEPLLALEAFFPAHLGGSAGTPVFVPALEATGGAESRASAKAVEHCAGTRAMVPESLTGDQRVRAMVRKLVDAELVPHLHWLHSLMLQALAHFRNSAQRAFPLVADTESQKRSLMLPLFASLLTMLRGSPPRLPERLHWTFQIDGDGLGEFERLAWLLQRCIADALEEDEAKESSAGLFKPGSRAIVSLEMAKKTKMKKKPRYSTIIEDNDEDDGALDGTDAGGGESEATEEVHRERDSEHSSGPAHDDDDDDDDESGHSEDDAPGMSQIAAPAINKWRNKLTTEVADEPRQPKKGSLPVSTVDAKMAPPPAKFSKWKEMLKTGMFTARNEEADAADDPNGGEHDEHDTDDDGGAATAANAPKRRMIYSDEEDA